MYLYGNCLLLELYRKLTKVFLSPRRESNPLPSDLRCGFDSRLGLRNIFLRLR